MVETIAAWIFTSTPMWVTMEIATVMAYAIVLTASAVVSKSLMPSIESVPNPGNRQQVPPSGDNKIPVVYGSAYVGGTITDLSITSDNQTVYYVLAISEVTNTETGGTPDVFSFGDIYWGGKRCVMNANYTFASLGWVGHIAEIGYNYIRFDPGFDLGGYGFSTKTTFANSQDTTIYLPIAIDGEFMTGYTITFDRPIPTTISATYEATNIVADATAVSGLYDESTGDTDYSINGYLNIYLYKNGSSNGFNTSTSAITIMQNANLIYQWDSTKLMTNCAFAIIKLNYNQKAGTTGLQQTKFQVINTRNTPGDCLLDYLTSARYGCAIPVAQIDTDSLDALNIYSNEVINFTTYESVTTTMKRFEFDGTVDTNISCLQNLQLMATSSDCLVKYNEITSKWGVVVQQPTYTVAMALDDSNLVSSISVSPMDIASTYNVIEAKYPDGDNYDGFATINYDLAVIDPSLMFPNEPVNKQSVSLYFVNTNVRAQLIANRLLEAAREDLQILVKVNYSGIQLEAGDIVTVTNLNYGWAAKTFRIMKITEEFGDNGAITASLQLAEFNPTVYDDINITQFTPSPNTGLQDANYFTALSAPTVSASYPSATIPSFDVTVITPAQGLITYGSLYYTTNSTPSSTDWKLWITEYTTNGAAFPNSTNYTFANVSLPAATYYFAFVVGNNFRVSGLSTMSASFVWTPVGMVGPTGPTGATGATGSTGDTGPRNAQVLYYYSTPQSSAPTAPTTGEVSYNFSTQTPSITASGWSAVFNPSAVGTTTANNKYWAIRCIFQETTYGGGYSETLSAVFTWQNMDGLVTFTNLSGAIGPYGSGATFIDGGSITANSVVVDRLSAGTKTVSSGLTFQLGTGATVGGYTSAGAFTSSNYINYGVLATNSAGGYGLGAGTTATTGLECGVVAVGSGNSTFSSYKNAAWLGAGFAGGVFQTGGANYTSSGITADIRLAYYSGGVSYAYYVVSGSAYPFTAGHDGLQLLTGDIPEPGDIMVDVKVIAAPSIENAITEMEVSATAGQKGAIGVFAGVNGREFVPAALGEYIEGSLGAKNNFVMKPEFANIYDTYRPIAVNAIGEGKINVCGQGGNIAVGDFISCSALSGKGMKQASENLSTATVAKARESVTFISSAEVKQISCIYLCG